jgi:hypothetical protein
MFIVTRTRTSCTTTFLRHIWHQSFFILSRHGSFALAFCEAFPVFVRRIFVALLKVAFEAVFRARPSGMYLKNW